MILTKTSHLLLVLPFLLLAVVASSNNFYNDGLPYCRENDSNQVVLVSTLDGKITALDPKNGGTPLWTVHPGNEPMLSSSIHRLELTNFGQLVRMIPSLNGGLYKFNGENIEPIPLTAEHLLQASFRYSDDLVISGGRESQTIGVSLETGEVLYECSMRGCSEEGRAKGGDVLLVQRVGQVVRAVEPRSGAERWNFSVAQHDLKVLSECHSESPIQRISLKVIVPEGLIYSTESEHSSRVLWKHQFDTPVVSAWEVQGRQVYEVDLFSPSSQLNDQSPSLYIGMHEKQLYIQESVAMLERRRELTMAYGKNLITYEPGANRLPWKPVVANSRNAGLAAIDDDVDTALDEAPTTALSVLYASPFVDGMGFFLFSKETLDIAEKAHCNATLVEEEHLPANEDEEDTPVTVVIVSLWYWWREVTIISITTAIVFNFLFTRRYLRLRNSKSLETPAPSKSDSGVVVIEHVQRVSESQAAEYESRYLSDFDPVHCLGRGGFGVVFEARNKIDDCHYAIKRIVLPDAQASRERVMREVRALAKLDHHNIVRYFNSWLESPPPGWQKKQDLQIIDKSEYSQLSDLGTETATSCFPPTHSVAIQSSASSSTKSESLSEEPQAVHNDVSDSFIVFASESNGHEDNLLNDNPSELHIPIEESEELESKQKNRKNRRRRRETGDSNEHSTICQSPMKVYLYIQMQLCRKESLKEWLQRNESRDYTFVMGIFEQIVKAVDYVHFHKLIHRDLKPSNIFFSLDHQIKIGDFGLVTTIADGTGRVGATDHENYKGHTSQVGTQLYMSPEQLSGKSYSYKVDIFSLGLILFELLHPFQTQMERLKLLQGVRQHCYPQLFTSIHQIEHKLLQRMLSEDPDKRPNTGEILEEPPLAHVDRDLSVKRHRRESSRTSISSGSSSDMWQDR